MADAVSIEELSGFGLAAVMARRGSEEAIATVFGCGLPTSPSTTTLATGAGSVRLIGTGPGTWLAFSDGGSHYLATELSTKLAGLASISDQSSGYVIFRVSGAGARKVLQRGAAIDFHPSVFGAGSAATTTIAHMGVIIWQVDEAPSYGVALFRSFAGSFRHWLGATIASL